MRTILFITALFMSTLLSAQKPVEIPLWPNGAPNTNGLTGDQEDLNGGRVANVVNPTITVYRPAKPNGMTILMCPGGGYARGHESRRPRHGILVQHTGNHVCRPEISYAERESRSAPLRCRTGYPHDSPACKRMGYQSESGRRYGSIGRRTPGCFSLYTLQ